MHSQNDEEKYVIEAVRNLETFKVLDIGAYNGFDLSNTYAILKERQGGSGVLVDACPSAFLGLLNIYGERPGIELVNVAITPTPIRELSKWHWSRGGAVSTFDAEHQAKWEASLSYKMVPMWVKTIGIEAFLDQFPGPYDVISIDTEASSANIFMAFPGSIMNMAKVVIVEHDSRQPELVDKASSLGFKVITANPENLVFIK